MMYTTDGDWRSCGSSIRATRAWDDECGRMRRCRTAALKTGAAAFGHGDVRRC